MVSPIATSNERPHVMINRIQLDADAQALPCKSCGFQTLRVAALVADNGTVLGRTVICTSCERSRHLAPSTENTV